MHLAGVEQPLPHAVVGAAHGEGEALLHLVDRPLQPRLLERAVDRGLEQRAGELLVDEVGRGALVERLRAPHRAGLRAAARVDVEHRDLR